MTGRPKIATDGIMVAHGISGFSLGVQQAEMPDISGERQIVLHIVEEIRLSPIVAKQLAYALSAQIRSYEDTFGEIRMPALPGKVN